MYNRVFTAQNNSDMFDTEIPIEDVLPPAVSNTASSSEVSSYQTNGGNYAEDNTSYNYGLWIICTVILVFLVSIAVFAVKKFALKEKKRTKKFKKAESKKTKKESIAAYNEESEKNEEDYIYTVFSEKQGKSDLATPKTLQECIYSFLENTKDT